LEQIHSLEEHLNFINGNRYSTLIQRRGSGERGKQGEKEFATVIWNIFKNSDIYVPSEREDMYDHWDISIKKKYFFDVKSNVDSEYTWIEFRSVNGQLGSIFGKATHIAFNLRMFEFLLVKRTNIIDMVERKVGDIRRVNPVRTRPNRPYILYQRENRNDLICKVPLDDLKNNGKILTIDGVVKKEEIPFFGRVE
jgi:hypothetical protein